MRKTTAYLPHDLKARLARPAPHIPLVESGIPDLAERVDDYLEGFGER